MEVDTADNTLRWPTLWSWCSSLSWSLSPMGIPPGPRRELEAEQLVSNRTRRRTGAAEEFIQGGNGHAPAARAFGAVLPPCDEAWATARTGSHVAGLAFHH